MAWNNDGPVVLEQLYVGIPEQYLTDYQAIHYFFTDETAVKKALKKLMKAAIKENVNSADDFQQFLTDIESLLGFTGVVTVSQNLGSNEFFRIVAKGETINDEGVTEKHGCWTHRVQWIVVLYSDIQLRNRLIDLYVGIAGIRQPWRKAQEWNPSSRMEPTEKFKPWTLWDALFDRGGDLDDICPNNGSYPEYFHGVWLKEPQQNDLGLLQKVWS